MGKIALLVSREEMLYQAHNILQEKKYSVKEMRVIRTESAVAQARRSIADGASIIIARGLQASLIKQYTDIPVVEIVLTAQEMALLVMRARQIVDKPRPVIAVIGFKNMFCDMSYFDQLYDINLRTYYTSQGREEGLKELVRQAKEEGADLVIGGDTAVEAATQSGMPSLFLSLTEDSLRNAFSMAQRVEYAMEVEKKSAAQMEALLDYAYNGVIRLGRDGTVLGMNPQMEDMAGRVQGEVKGRPVGELAPEISADVLERVLGEGKEYSLFLEMNHASVFAVLAPVLYDDKADGAVITCHKVARRPERGGGGEREKRAGAFPILPGFEDLLQQSASMKQCVHLARLYALSEKPVVIIGEPGTEKRMMAQSIHGGGSLSREPFVELSCYGLSDGEQRERIFGSQGGALLARNGTLLIEDADHLTASNQERLFRLIRFHSCQDPDTGQPKKVGARVMLAMERPLSGLLRQGKINRELYYALAGLELRIPPLRERPEDLDRKLEDAIRECRERYGRFHVLTEGARKVLMEYPWEGNLLQADAFCHRLILTANRRSIDQIAVKELLRELYGEEPETGREEGEDGQPCQEAQEIARILKKHGGSREKAAGELGISKATLWRKMKKYEMTDGATGRMKKP